MSVQVLQSRQQIVDARARLRERGLDLCTSFFHNVLFKLGLRRSPRVGDALKSWDVLETVRLIEEHLPNDAPILDLGAFSSEVLLVLDRLGYTALSGIDFDPRIGSMPHADRIVYHQGDFLRSSLPDAGFAAITAISVIEHGFDGETLLAELARLLRPGGLFVASTDYWPEKIDTSGKRLFGVDWRIFSQEELSDFITTARRFGFVPLGPMSFAAARPVIHWGGRRYTFVWIALRREEQAAA